MYSSLHDFDNPTSRTPRRVAEGLPFVNIHYTVGRNNLRLNPLSHECTAVGLRSDNGSPESRGILVPPPLNPTLASFVRRVRGHCTALQEGPMKSIQAVITSHSAAAAMLCLLCSTPAMAAPFTFSTGSPDGLMATAARPESAGKFEIES